MLAHVSNECTCSPSVSPRWGNAREDAGYERMTLHTSEISFPWHVTCTTPPTSS